MVLKTMKIKKQALNDLKDLMLKCEKCKLHKSRNKVVFGDGKENSKLMLIGEGPGRNEDLLGKPFIGDSGKLMFEIFKEAHLTRDNIFISNIVHCRPTINCEGKIDRKPLQNEIDACIPYLYKQIKIIKPRIIITVGNVSTHNLLKIKDGITHTHGKIYYYDKIPVIPMYHPSYIYRNGGHNNSYLKTDMLNDLKIVWEVLKSMGKEK